MLSEEEKKAIKLLEDIKNNSWTTKYIMSSDSKNADILLNLITKLQKENEEKDKQIDLMAEEYEYNDRINFKNFCEDELRKDKCIQDCKICAKQYFETKAKKGE